MLSLLLKVDILDESMLMLYLYLKCYDQLISSLVRTKKLSQSQYSAQCSRPHQKLFFMNSTSIDKKFRYSLKKLPGSWKIYFFYFKHCVLTISKWHLPTCRTEIGEFHSIKCLFWTPIFFMITAFHTMAINIFFSRNLLNFLKIQVILAGVSRKKCDSPFLKVGFFREKPTLGYPIDFLRIFFRIFSEFFLKKSHLGLKKI